MISGFATSEETKNFSEKFLTENYNSFQNLYLSNVVVWTYLGDPNSQTDEMVVNAVKKSVLSGINVIDTAINYRAQKSERNIGKALSELINESIYMGSLFPIIIISLLLITSSMFSDRISFIRGTWEFI